MGYFTENIDAGMLYAVNEAYFGKTNGVLKIERAIHNIRKKYGTGNAITNKNTWQDVIPNSKEELYLRKAIADEFGFSDVCILWIHGLLPSIATFQNSLAIDLGHKRLNRSMKKNSSSKTGFKFDKSDGIALMMLMCTGAFTSDILTDAEITAIMLHEIGHNFTASVDDNILYQCPVMRSALSVLRDIIEKLAVGEDEEVLIGLITDIGMNAVMFSNFSHKQLAKFQDINNKNYQQFTDKQKNINGITSSIPSIIIEGLMSISHIKGFIDNFLWFKKPLAKLFGTKLLSRIFVKPLGYSDEKFADAFAQMYGYGPELITGLQKLRTQYSPNIADEYISKVPLLSSIVDLYIAPYRFIMSLVDEHPYDPARYNMIVDNLRYELKNVSMDSNTRKLIERDIKNAEDSIDEFNNIYASDLVKRGGGMRLYQKVLNIMFGGDIRYKLGLISNKNKTMDMIDYQLNNN